ncbi:Yip1 family protein [Aestuariibacter sp. A3R04]|uniref:Yip1 family protein n=1 Tax=Aestuariibacter sp. A3R04 TaxID=2841571 RepID=UPI001C0A499C|nr:Yip1 family protein [Aestuariibacter sp. A3R04]MBU3020536.1 YIP1 family protein [Aestuariibacter sp. A3R04]
MSNHIWGLIHHPDKEWRSINEEHETVSHLYTHHVLWYALIPVVCSFIGTTRFGWTFGGEEVFQISVTSGLALGVVFYALILAAVAVVGSVIHWMAKKYPERPSKAECIVFAGYTATPLFLSGVFALYPVFWLCVLACVIGLCYTAYLLYAGTPSFLGISRKQGFILSTSTLCIGVLVLEVLMIAVVLLWSMGSEHSIVWHFFS